MDTIDNFEKTITNQRIERWRYPRFFASTNGDTVVVTGEDAKHIGTVLRMKAGNLAVLCDGEGADCLCRISAVNKECVEFEVLDRQRNEAEPSVFVTLYQCMPKGDKMDFIVQKAVELGVGKVVPVLSKRCVSRPDEKSFAKKIQRWQKIAEEAAKQCGRGKIPEVGGQMDFRAAVTEYSNGKTGILFYECGGTALSDIVDRNVRELDVFVGCEGGFEAEEAELALEYGIVCATLGKRILRCETAPVAALAVLMNLTGNM